MKTTMTCLLTFLFVLAAGCSSESIFHTKKLLGLVANQVLKWRVEATRSVDTGNPQLGLKTLFDLSATLADGKIVELSDYGGQVVLIINVASECGFTDTSYKNLVRLHEKYGEQGFTIFAFPCNQFGAQEPNPSHVVQEYIQSQYQGSFPVFSKADVNGAKTGEIFRVLKSYFPGDVIWNFHGIWLVNRLGIPIARFDDPDYDAIESQIVDELSSHARKGEL